MFRRCAAVLAACLVVVAGAGNARAATGPNLGGITAQQWAESFVTRSGSTLQVDGRPFRFSGANVEFLGLENYGPNPSKAVPLGSEKYPSAYEVDDALATAHEMGATVLRVQTLGDTVGCALCIEPSLGVFNPKAFAATDFLVAEARRYGIKLLGEFDGDANGAPATGVTALQLASHSWYCSWEKQTTDCGLSFFSSPALIADYERHMAAVLDHVNPLTGLSYKDDPTIAGWVDGNNLNLLDGVPPPVVESWISTVSAYFKGIDTKQLYADISLTGGDEEVTPTVLAIPGVDVYGQEYYPHWFPVAQGGDRVDGTAPLLHAIALQTATAGKVFAPLEFGWDNTNFLTPAALQQFLAGLQSDTNVAGDLFWALVSHRDGHGWQPVPADTGCSPSCETLEDGNWWALYYTGLATLSNTASDMAARAQLLRAHSYAMDGYATVPAHEAAPAPVLTSVASGHLYWEGSAGSPSYSVQRRLPGGAWSAACTACVTDASDGWQDATNPPAGTCWRMTGRNLDGVETAPSAQLCSASAGTVRVAKRPGTPTKPVRRAASAGAGQPGGTLAYTGANPWLGAAALLLLTSALVVRRRSA